MSQELALQIRGLDKHFGGQQALDDVDFELRRGEIHALLGENGAGKSTLIKILAGAVPRDDGEIRIGGRVISEGHLPGEAAEAGLAFVHQDLALVDGLSVAENIALELGYDRRAGLISFARTQNHVRELLAGLGLEVSPETMVGDLAQDQKVMVAVTRAVSKGAAVVVLDEVSSSLPAPEMERLAASLRAAQRTGVAYIYVTHRLEEVFDLADRVTVLRDGKRVTTSAVASTSHDEIVGWILGQSVEQTAREPTAASETAGAARLSVLDLMSDGLAAPLSFEVRAGEILGFCGLIGSGSREVARLLGGAAAPSAGSAELDGRMLHLGSPYKLARAGVAYVPGSRATEGAIPEMAIRENLFLARQREAGDGILNLPSRERPRAAALARDYDVRPPGVVEQPLSSLSGGNQQKVIFARALRSKPRLLVLDDPTAGVDVGSRVQLHGFLRACAEQGAAVVLTSTDFEEIASQSNRVLVMRHGRLAQKIVSGTISTDRLARASYGAAHNDGRSEVAS